MRDYHINILARRRKHGWPPPARQGSRSRRRGIVRPSTRPPT